MDTKRFYEDDFNSFLEDLVSSHRIEGIEAGITKYVIDHGYDALSIKQKNVFDKMIANNTVSECKRCATDIPWSEMLDALDNGGLCNWCQHMEEKEE